MRDHAVAISERVRNRRLRGRRSTRFQEVAGLASIVHKFYTMDRLGRSLTIAQAQAVSLDAERPAGGFSMQRFGSTVRPPQVLRGAAGQVRNGQNWTEKRNRPATLCRSRRTDVIATRTDLVAISMLAKDYPFQQLRRALVRPLEGENRMNRILRTPEVVRVTGLSKTTIWRRVRSGDFPAPVKLGSPDSRSIGWRQEEIEKWIESRPVIED